MKQHSRSRSPRDRPDGNVPLILAIPTNLIGHFSDAGVVLEIKRKSGLSGVSLKQSSDVPDFQDGLLYMTDSNIETLRNAVTRFLEECESGEDYGNHTARIWIPAETVPLLIGKKGATVRRLSEVMHTKIDLQDRIPGLDERVVEISSRNLSNIVRAIIKIYEMASGREQPRAAAAPPSTTGRSPSKSASTIQFCVNNSTARDLEDLETSFREKISNNFSCSYQIINESYADDTIVQVTGSTHETRQAYPRVIQHIAENGRRGDDIVFLLPTDQASQVVGNRGFVPKEIYSKLRGASLRSLPQRATSHIGITVSGSLQQQTDAVGLILDRLEDLPSSEPTSLLPEPRRRSEINTSPDDYGYRDRQELQRRSPEDSRRRRDMTFENKRDQFEPQKRSPSDSYYRRDSYRRSPVDYRRPTSPTDYRMASPPSSYRRMASPTDYRKNSSPMDYRRSSPEYRRRSPPGRNTWEFDGRKSPPYEDKPRRNSSPTESKTDTSELNIIVPDELVARLIGRSGEMVKSVMKRTKTHINYFKSEDNPNVSASSGQKGRICTISGAHRDVAQAVELILLDISKYHSTF